MSDPYTGEIQLYGFNFAPYRWALCTGQTIPVSQNTALFSLLGNAYGGDGISTFLLPNLVGRTPISQGQAPGLTAYSLGQTEGVTSVTLSAAEMPSHNHTLSMANGAGARSSIPSNNQSLSTPAQSRIFTPGPPNTNLSPAALSGAGGGLPHENRQPFLALNYSIALAGRYPSTI